MTIGDYLKAAASQLRQAAYTAKTDGDGLRRKITDTEINVTKAIDQLQKTIQQRQNDLRALQSQQHSDFKTAEQDMIKSLEQEVQRIRQSFEREKQKLILEIQHKEDQAINLNAHASRFEQQAMAV